MTNEIQKEVARIAWAKEFPHLKQVEGYNTLVTAAKNIRTELKKAFPGVKFSVTSDRFAGGDAIRVSWTDGPTDDAVTDITNKYKAGHFNGMEDIYEYSSDLWTEIFGDAKYISTSRAYSDAAVDAAIAAVVAKYGGDTITVADYRQGKSWSWRNAPGPNAVEMDRPLRQHMSTHSF